MNRIPTLDGWRGLAISLVLISHAGLALGHRTESLGQHGVTIFFVLSGFLITSRLLREQELHGKINLKHFYIRRFFRLMPAAWSYLAVLGVMVFIGSKSVSTLHLPACLFFFRNYVDRSGAHTLITGHFWSLSIEEQFYLIWPSLLILLGTKRARWVSLAGAMSVAIWRFIHLDRLMHSPLQATFGTQYRADALLLGCAAALFLPELRTLAHRWMLLPLTVALIACICINRYLVPSYESALVALLLVTTTELPGSMLGRLLDLKPLVFLGTVSYSLYVWQQPVLWTHTPSALAIILSITFMSAAASYYLIERPLIEKGRSICARPCDYGILTEKVTR